MDTDRGTGRTTRQLKEAPTNAIFISCGHGDRGYIVRLAAHLGRTDIRVETPDYFDERWQGIRRPVVTDHAALEMLTRRQLHMRRECARYLEAHGISCA